MSEGGRDGGGTTKYNCTCYSAVRSEISKNLFTTNAVWSRRSEALVSPLSIHTLCSLKPSDHVDTS